VTPFARGALNFDDFNYNNVNQYVLLEEPADKREALRKRREALKLKTQGKDNF